MNPHIELGRLGLSGLQAVMDWLQRAQGVVFGAKIHLIRKIRGEQSGYGW